MGDVNIANSGGFNELAYVQADDLPTANSDMFVAGASVTNRVRTIRSRSLVRVDFCPQVADAVLSVTIYNIDTAVTSDPMKLFGGSKCTLGVKISDEFYATNKETLNFQCSVAGGKYRLLVREV